MKINFLSNFYKFLVFVLLFLNVCSYMYSTILVNSSVNKNKITLGDRINYYIKIEHSPDIVLEPIELGSNLGEFEIKDYKIIGPKKKWYLKMFSLTKRIFIEYRYVITTFTTGEFKIPPVNITYLTPAGEKKQISTGEITILVEGIKPTEKDKDDIRDIKPPVSLPLSKWTYIGVILFLFLVIGGIISYHYYQNKKIKSVFITTNPSLPPHELAYQQIQKLISSGLVEQGKIKEYYILLSEIIRKYLEQRFSIPVIDRTTTEVYYELREIDQLDKKHCTLIKEFLQNCDLVKFAKYIPEKEIIEKDTEKGKNIVDLTKPVELSSTN